MQSDKQKDLRISDIIPWWLGWCPNAPAIRTTPALLVVPPETIHPTEPGGSRSAGGSGRVRDGISIATGSLKAMFRDRQLLWFTALAGLVMFFLVAVEEWTVAHIQSYPPFLIDIPIGDPFLANSYLDTRLFLVETICLFCFTILLAGLILYRAGNRAHKPLTIRQAFAGVSAHAGPLVILSIAMALFGTVLDEIISQSQFFGKIIMTVSMAVFNLPYAYYLPNPLSAAIYISVKIMVVNILLFLLALYVIPFIVLEKKGLVHALAGSTRLMRKTWRELVGCAVVFGVIVLGIFTVALIIGQSPFLLNRDFDFFINLRRGQMLMTVVCYGFIAVCWALMAAGSTVAGIAIMDLYSCGTDSTVKREQETSGAVAEPAG